MKCDSIDKILDDLEGLLAEQQTAAGAAPDHDEKQEPGGGGPAAVRLEDSVSVGEPKPLKQRTLVPVEPVLREPVRLEPRVQRPEIQEPEEHQQETDTGSGAPVSRRRKQREKRGRLAYEGILRPNDGLIAAFAVPVIIMIIIFTQKGIFPFGEESFLRTDMYHQYAPFFSEFQNKLKNGGSLLYSWNIGMGVNFAALYAYYLASPLNWLIVLCPKNLIIEFMTYSIVLKIGLCGLTMAWYLRRHCRTKDFGIAFFGIFYALSGYIAAYSWNIMWLDCILLLPLIALGLERLVKERKGMLYGVTLGFSILSNYYISIMICIFMVLYFIALLVLEEEMGWKKFVGCCGRFAVFSLLAGGMAAAVLLPEIYALQMTASGDVNFPKTVSSYFSIFDMIARHIAIVETEIGLDHWPNLYCGVAVLLFFVLYLISGRVKAREKVVYCVLLLFFLASFSNNVLNFLWHGFHFPNSLPCRQSFIYIFLMLLMCYRAYMHLGEVPKRHITYAFYVSCGFVILAEKLVTESHFHFSIFYVALFFLAVYTGLVFLYRRGKKYQVAAIVAALLTVSIESATNMTITSVTTTSRTEYMKDNQAVRNLVEALLPNKDFFRVEKVTRKTKNDGAWMNFPSVSLFSSTANADLSDFFKKVGCESSTNAYSITGSTPLVDMLVGVKYGLYTGEAAPSGIRTLLQWEDEIYLYENTYSMPAGWLVNEYFDQDWYLDAGNPADVQNALADMTGSAHVLSQVMDGTDEGERYTFVPEHGGEYYAYIGNKQVEKVTVVREGSTKSYNNVNRGYFVDIGFCEVGEEVVIRSETGGQGLIPMVYRFSEEALAEVYEGLNRYPLKLTGWGDAYLEGTIDAGYSGVLFTTIPFDKGWTVKIDGTPRETGKIAGAFLSVVVPEGTHSISFEYQPEGLAAGSLISVGSVVLLGLIFLGGRWMDKRRQAEPDWEDEDIEEDYDEDDFDGDELTDEESPETETEEEEITE